MPSDLIPPDVLADRLERLRAAFDAQGIDGFIVPRGDEHQGEYVPPSAMRLAWMTGFSGSAGTAVILRKRAALFIDGRYTLQAKDETPEDLFEHRHLVQQPVTDWIADVLDAGAKLGFDPRLTTPNQATRYRKAATRAGGTLVAVDANPVDAIWDDRPAPPRAPIVPHDVTYAGRDHADKCSTLGARLGENGQAAMVIAEPDCIAWLLNVRGGDLEYLPQPLSFAILHDDARVDWFVDSAKLSGGLTDHLGDKVTVHEPEALGEVLDALGSAGKTVRIDPDSVSEWVRLRLSEAGATIAYGADLCLSERARKTAAEQKGMRDCHLRDGIALTRFLAWLDRETPSGEVTEIAAANQLEAFRREGDLFRGLSFPTISGAGPNGAIVHYRVTPRTNRPLGPGELYLVDSGAQYLDGTTDVTRTVAIGEPTAEMRHRFTLVLKGHIAVATARFPVGTSGSQLDAFARRPLWAEGLDYDHGTGHGVGSYLSVHEGPQRIAKAPNTVALAAGMVVSNEPGYYKTGAYGIRIENLVLVVEDSNVPAGAERDLLTFETLTLAPIDRRLISVEHLDPGERAWIDAYHDLVRTALSPALTGDDAGWLAAATAPLTGI